MERLKIVGISKSKFWVGAIARLGILVLVLAITNNSIWEMLLIIAIGFLAGFLSRKLVDNYNIRNEKA